MRTREEPGDVSGKETDLHSMVFIHGPSEVVEKSSNEVSVEEFFRGRLVEYIIRVT